MSKNVAENLAIYKGFTKWFVEILFPNSTFPNFSIYQILIENKMFIVNRKTINSNLHT